MSTDKIKKTIISRLATYTDGHVDNVQRQATLRQLVDDYSIELVALAAGLTESTLHQYIRVKQVPAIRHDSVLQAQRILKGL